MSVNLRRCQLNSIVTGFLYTFHCGRIASCGCCLCCTCHYFDIYQRGITTIMVRSATSADIAIPLLLMIYGAYQIVCNSKNLLLGGAKVVCNKWKKFKRARSDDSEANNPVAGQPAAKRCRTTTEAEGGLSSEMATISVSRLIRYERELAAFRNSSQSTAAPQVTQITSPTVENKANTPPTISSPVGQAAPAAAAAAAAARNSQARSDASGVGTGAAAIGSRHLRQHTSATFALNTLPGEDALPDTARNSQASPDELSSRNRNRATSATVELASVTVSYTRCEMKYHFLPSSVRISPTFCFKGHRSRSCSRRRWGYPSRDGC